MIGLKDVKMKKKLIGVFLVVGLVPLALVGWWSVRLATNELMDKSYAQLEAVRGIKKLQIEKFFEERKDGIGVLMETVKTLRQEAFSKLEAVKRIKQDQMEDYFNTAFIQMGTFARSEDVNKIYEELFRYHDDSGVAETGPFDVTTERYRQIYTDFAGNINQFQKESGYYDVFLICASHGHVMYSAARESDLGTNLGHGTYKDSGLAMLWKKITNSQKKAIIDFRPYAPSNNEQAAFAGFPIEDKEGRMQGVIAFQLSTKHIDRIMQKRDGLGKTGETYLVGKSDGKSSLRSDRVVKSGKIGEEKTDVYIEKALSGSAGQGIKSGSTGGLEIVMYSPLDIPGINWAMLCTMSLEEAVAPVLEGEEEDFFAKYVAKYGYQDLFLINADGFCFYSVGHESDYGTNLLTGKYSNSNLGRLIRQVKDTKQFGIADFEPYAPGNNQPRAFIAQPLVHDGEVVVVVALQLHLDHINEIMRERGGMGKTGETYLVGSDKRMRSDSFLDGEGRSVAASFAGTVEKNGVDTEASREALAGKTDMKIVVDYNGNPVLSAYAPIKIGDFTWALLAEIDESEVMAPVNRLLLWIACIGAILSLLIAFAALFFAKSIADPLAR